MSKPPPWGLAWRSSTLFIVSTVGIGLFTDLFLYGLVVPILPFILQNRIHMPQEQIQSSVSGLLAAYAAASVVFSPSAGILADRLPTRQVPFLVGLVALLLATLLLLLGRTIAVLVVARILQGISAAVVWTIGLALVLDTVGPANLGKTIGSIFGFISIGELAAPILGGIIYKQAGYGGVFGLGFALLALDFIMRLLLVEKKTAAAYDTVRSSATNGNAASIEAQNVEDDDYEDTEEEPLIKKQEEDYYKVAPDQPKIVRSLPILYCLKDPRLLTAQLLAFVQAFLLGTFDATVPMIAAEFFGFDSLKSGLIFIALILPYLVLGPIAGWTVDHYGPKPAAVAGFGYLVPILVLLRLAQPGGRIQIITYCALLSLCGLGLGVIGSPSIVEAAYVVQRYDKANPGFFGTNGPYAQLYAINSMVFSAGLTVGPLVAGLLKDVVGYGNMNIVVAALCLITATLSFIYIGGKPRMLKKGRD